ncbi:hypothetical protein [Deinococcus sp. S9]|uniref:hypothetical protein n=1 Tax=Deinococcus sp. S9 TaxID=2545754 RepID=UPI001055AF45|nr:hypothetical protein [Deinococcus sp. S9]TDE87408.1 hypothetical protein E0686_02635 [Deinococcus sp. S9]
MTTFTFPRNDAGDIVIQAWEDAMGRVELAFDDEPYIAMYTPGGKGEIYWDAYGNNSFKNLLLKLESDADYAAYLPLRHLVTQAVALDTEIRAFDQEENGYAFLKHRPHIKGFIRDVTTHYDEDWRAGFPGLERIEEMWFYDDSRRYHLASFTASVEAHAISERAIWNEDVLDRVRDEAENDLSGFTEYVDYFSGVTPDWDGGEASDGEVRALLLGDMTYTEFMEAWAEHLRGNEEF